MLDLLCFGFDYEDGCQGRGVCLSKDDIRLSESER